MTTFKKGAYNIICDVCGDKLKSTESRKRWDGMITCKVCWEARHPADFPPPIFKREGRGVKDARPAPEVDTFIEGVDDTSTYNLTWDSIAWQWQTIDINWEDL